MSRFHNCVRTTFVLLLMLAILLIFLEKQYKEEPFIIRISRLLDERKNQILYEKKYDEEQELFIDLQRASETIDETILQKISTNRTLKADVDIIPSVDPRNKAKKSTTKVTTIPKKNTIKTTVVPRKNTSKAATVFKKSTTKATTISLKNTIKTTVAPQKITSKATTNATKTTTVSVKTATKTTIVPQKIYTKNNTTKVQTISVKNVTAAITLSEINTIAGMPLCSERGENLVGPVFVDQNIPKDMTLLENIYSKEHHGTVERGGWWSPNQCKPRKKVAIIIPYRNRLEQLKVFLQHMHRFLQKQQLYYQIFIVEQLEADPFNRATLFNIGFVEALKVTDFDCFIFSDVDLLPEDDRNYYGCPTSPRHMSVAVDTFNYKLPYATIFGGVCALKREHFESVNGFSNSYWGWGAEDDDLYERLKSKGLNVTRPALEIGRYTMVKINHFQSSGKNPERNQLLTGAVKRMSTDGLNSLVYQLKEVDKQPLVTFIRVVLKKEMYY